MHARPYRSTANERAPISIDMGEGGDGRLICKLNPYYYILSLQQTKDQYSTSLTPLHNP